VCKRGEYGVIGRGGGLRQISPAAKYLEWSIFKKSRHLGFGVFIDIWSMTYCALVKYIGTRGWAEREDKGLGIEEEKGCGIAQLVQ
jgi:hypothetical protein